MLVEGVIREVRAPPCWLRAVTHIYWSVRKWGIIPHLWGSDPHLWGSDPNLWSRNPTYGAVTLTYTAVMSLWGSEPHLWGNDPTYGAATPTYGAVTLAAMGPNAFIAPFRVTSSWRPPQSGPAAPWSSCAAPERAACGVRWGSGGAHSPISPSVGPQMSSLPQNSFYGSPLPPRRPHCSPRPHCSISPHYPIKPIAP